MYNEKSNIYTITIIIFDSVRRNFDERPLSFTNEINKRIDPRPPNSYNDQTRLKNWLYLHGNAHRQYY